jgi:hypothetical protein
MNPIHVTIQNIAPGDEIPDTDFKIRGHKISGRTLTLTLEARTKRDFQVQALWNEVSQKLYLVGRSADWVSETGDIGTLSKRPSKINVSIDLKPLGRKTSLKIFKMARKRTAGFDHRVYRDRQEKLLMSVNTRSRKIIPTYENKKTAPIHQIPLQRLEQEQEIPSMDFEILYYKIMHSTFTLFIADSALDESSPPQIQAFWDESHQKLYLSGGKCEHLSKTKRREIWLHIDIFDISSLGLRKKIHVFKRTDENQEEHLLTCSVPGFRIQTNKLKLTPLPPGFQMKMAPMNITEIPE